MNYINRVEKTNIQPPSLTVIVKDGRKYLEEFRELGPLLIRESLSFKDRLFGFFRRHLWRQVRIKTKGSSDLEELDCFIDMVPLHELQEEVLERTIRLQKYLNPSLLLTKKKGIITVSSQEKKKWNFRSLFTQKNEPKLLTTKTFQISQMNGDKRENSKYLLTSVLHLKNQLEKLKVAEKDLPITSVSFKEMDVTQALS